MVWSSNSNTFKPLFSRCTRTFSLEKVAAMVRLPVNRTIPRTSLWIISSLPSRSGRCRIQMHKGQVFIDRLAYTLYMQTNWFAHYDAPHRCENRRVRLQNSIQPKLAGTCQYAAGPRAWRSHQFQLGGFPVFLSLCSGKRQSLICSSRAAARPVAMMTTRMLRAKHAGKNIKN